MTAQLRVFISSPGDVAAEREAARQVVAKLQTWYGTEQVDLVPLLWEDLPLQAVTSFQAGVDTVLSATTGVDIAVFILWSRLGTPLGLEIRKADGSVYRSGTEREFDLMLCANRQTQGERPAMLVYVRKDDAAFHHRLSGRKTGELKEMVDQRDAVEHFIRTQFQDAEGHNRGAYHGYSDPASFALRLRTHLRELIDARLQLSSGRDPLWTDTPYRGLDYFDIDHSRIFFGRGRETCDVLQLLRDRETHGEASFVCIVGASGAGKSSLARAGVAATLRDELDDTELGPWRIGILVPAEADGVLQRGLLKALMRAFPELAETLGTEPSTDLSFDNLAFGFDTAVKNLLTGLDMEDKDARLLLSVDQLEEIYLDPRIGQEQRASFWRFLGHAARSGIASVVVTLRSDFYAAAQKDEGFLDLKGAAGMLDLGPPRPETLESIIRRPAAMGGLTFEHDADGHSLSSRILADAQAHPESLPSLQDLMRALYARRNHGTQLTYADYEALGGIAGVIGRRAEAVFGALPQSQRDALPRLLRRLVTIRPDDGVAAARAVNPADLKPESPERQLANALLAPEARLLVARADGLRIVHESLLHNWPLAARCIEDDRPHHQTHAHLRNDFEQWMEAGQTDDLLLPEGRKLERARSLILAWGDDVVGDAIVRYVRRSGEKVDGRRSSRRVVVSIVGLVGLLMAALGTRWLIQARAEADSRLHAEELSRMEQAARRGMEGIDASKRGELSLGWYLAAEAAALVPREGTPPAQVELSLDELHSHPRPPVVLRGHDGPLTRVILSPDGRRALTASEDGTARLWETETGRHLATLRGHQYTVAALAFSHDGTLVATGSDDATVRLWETRTGRESLPSLDAHKNNHKDNITGVSFCGTCARLLTASRDGTAIVWDSGSGKPVSVLPEHEGPILVSALSPDGNYALTASDTNKALLWKVDSDAPPKILDHPATIALGTFTTDGKHVVTATNKGAIRVWDLSGNPLGAWDESDAMPVETDGRQMILQRFEANRWRVILVEVATGQRVSEFDSDARIVAAGFSADGKLLVTAAEDGAARLWETASGRELAAFRGHRAALTSVAISADGKRAITGSDDETAQLWDTSEPQTNFTVAASASANAVAFSPDARRLLAAFDDKTARLWAMKGHELAVLRGHDNALTSAAFGPAGNSIVTGSLDGTGRLWDLDGQELAMLKGHENALRSVAFSHDGKLILSASVDGTARLWDAATGRPAAVMRGHRGPVRQAIFAPDGQRVATISADVTARLWNLDGKALAVLKGHDDALLSVAFSPDGKLLATGSRDATVRVWDAGTGHQITVLTGHRGSVKAVALSPDGTWLASGGSDKDVRIWTVESGQERAVLRGHDDAINALAFSPDGTSLVSASDDKMAREWDVATWRQTGKFSGHTHWIGALAYSPDGTRIATGSEDHTVRIWPTHRNVRDQADYARAMSPEFADAALVERLGLTLEPRFERAIPQRGTATPCDQLAAHPFDGARVAGGVAWNKLDGKAALTACTRAAESDPGNARLSYQLGRALEKLKDPAARAPLQKAAEAGYARAQGAVGDFLIDTQKDENIGSGVEWLRRAANAGDPVAQDTLADLLVHGERVPQDLREAKRLFGLAATQGLPYAHQHLAELAESGDPSAGVEPDFAAAFFHHALAARCAQAVADEGSARAESERRAAIARLLPEETVIALWRKASQWKPGQTLDLRP
ncbi:MAG: hypothetical protein E6Q99_10385 [Elusimicrobia bacterium]|nr:MAG: hypothetical protein E6Q99_10385 [Elusimicrobiota bacterium]